MYHSEAYQTKWHDTDPSGVIRPSRLLEYMQETGSRQCRAAGMDLDTLFHKEGKGFILSRLRLRVDAPIHAYETIEVRTWCPPSRALTFLRCFSVLRDGAIVAEATSTWAFVDAKNHSFIKVDDFHGDFPVDEPLDEHTLPKTVRLPRALAMTPVGERTVRYSDVDFNRHMNNTKYPDMVWDFLPTEAVDGHRMATLSLSYLHEAALGDTVKVYRAAAADRPDTYLLRTVNAAGDTCLEAEISVASL